MEVQSSGLRSSLWANRQRPFEAEVLMKAVFKNAYFKASRLLWPLRTAWMPNLSSLKDILQWRLVGYSKKSLMLPQKFQKSWRHTRSFGGRPLIMVAELCGAYASKQHERRQESEPEPPQDEMRTVVSRWGKAAKPATRYATYHGSLASAGSGLERHGCCKWGQCFERCDQSGCIERHCLCYECCANACFSQGFLQHHLRVAKPKALGTFRWTTRPLEVLGFRRYSEAIVSWLCLFDQAYSSEIAEVFKRDHPVRFMSKS